MAYAELDPNARNVDDGVIVDAAWNETPLLQLIPGSHHRRGVWYVPRTYAAAIQLRGVFGPSFTYGPLLTAWLWEERRTRVDPVMYVRDALILPDAWSHLGDGFDSSMRPFQVVGAIYLLLAGDGVLGDAMGTGKTVTTLGALNRLGAAGLPALVICPNGLKRHWARLAARWCPDATSYIVAGGPKEKARILKDAQADPTALVIVNVEATRGLSRLAPYGSVKLIRCRQCDKNYGEDIKPSKCQVHPKELNGFGFKVAIQDEVHRSANPQSQQTRAMWAIFHDPSVRYRWGLSGTLADQPDKLWSIMHGVAPTEFPVKSKFMDRYALMSWAASGGSEVVGLSPTHQAELFTFFDPRYRRIPKELALPQLPPKIRTSRVVTLTPAQRRAYTQIDATNTTRLESGELLITFDNLTAATRLMQIAAGSIHVELDEGADENDLGAWRVRIKDPSPKLDEMEQVIDELDAGDRFAVAAVHVDLVDLACARLERRGISYGRVTGRESEFERDQAIQRLAEGKIRAIVFSIQAGSEGHDMSPASTLIVLQRAWSYRDDSQMSDRVHRYGSIRHEFVRIIDIICEDTIEDDQLKRLYERYELAEQINRDRAKLIAAGVDVDGALARLESSSLMMPLSMADLTTTAPT